MENKKITYIVFKDYNDLTDKQEGIIFFEDGTYLEIKNDRKALINYMLEYAKQENITTIEDLFYNNNNLVYADSKANQQEIIDKFVNLSKEINLDNIIDEVVDQITRETEEQAREEETQETEEPVIEEENQETEEPVVEEENSEIEDDIEEQIKKDKENTLFARFKKKSKKFKVTVTALGLSAVLALAASGYSLIKGLFGKKQTNTTSQESTKNPQDRYQDMSYEELLACNKVTQTQKTEMTKVGQFLDYFNKRFANTHTENDKNIKAALTWDETIALNLVYNNHTPHNIVEIFNGCGEIENSSELDNLTESYKTALSQLTKSYVIEDKNASIGLDNLINEPAGKAFYTKYHNMFMKCKNSKGQEQINNVDNFYKQIITDFGIDKGNQVNTDIESYKLSIIPMISASEILFQNLETDNTMSDEVIKYFNDLNLYNKAITKLEECKTTATLEPTNNYYLHYKLFKEQKIEELNNENAYFKNDEQRDLSKLTLFNDIISGYNSINPDQEAYLNNNDSTYTESKTTETTNRDVATNVAGEEKVNQAEQVVNNTINTENEQEKQNQEKIAEEKRQKLQQEEDKKKEQIDKEVYEENKELEDKINDINNDINKDKDITEKDFGITGDGEYIVDINNEYIDNNGNIDNTIKDITTNINQNNTVPLPTPTDKGAEEGYNDVYIYSDQIITEEVELTDEQIADMIIESMANQSQNTEENTKTYTYTK